MISTEELLDKAQLLVDNKKYLEVIELLPDNLLKSYQKASLYAEKAGAYWRLKEYELCNENVEKALIINSLNAKANNYKANIYKEQKNYDAAIEYYNRALQINRDYASPYNGLGNIYSYLNENDKAISYYNRALENNPNFAFAHFGLGMIYKRLKKYDKAFECFNKSIEADPQYVAPYNSLGVLYRIQKDYDKAREYFNKAIEIDPQYIFPYIGLGNVYSSLKSYQNAIEYYNKAIRLDPQLPDSYYNRAYAYYRTEKYKEALIDYKKFIESNTNKSDYNVSLAKSRIDELQKLLKSADYTSLSEIVGEIKKLLLFKDECVTHYTSFFVAKMLILEESRFRLSEGTYLNDTSEGRELFNFLSSIPIFSTEANDTVANPFASKPFIGSFVAEKKNNDLTLWRMYGKENKDEAKGCAITIDRGEMLKSLKDSLLSTESGMSENIDEEFSFYKVAYRKQNKGDYFIIPGATKRDEKKLNKLMQDLFEFANKFLQNNNEINDKKNLLELLNGIAYLFKSDEYQYEHELRLVVKGIGVPKIIDRDFSPPKVYIELIKINSLIKKITLGPKVERSDEWASAFFYIMDLKGLHPEILISHLPFK